MGHEEISEYERAPTESNALVRACSSSTTTAVCPLADTWYAAFGWTIGAG